VSPLGAPEPSEELMALLSTSLVPRYVPPEWKRLPLNTESYAKQLPPGWHLIDGAFDHLLMVDVIEVADLMGIWLPESAR